MYDFLKYENAMPERLEEWYQVNRTVADPREGQGPCSTIKKIFENFFLSPPAPYKKGKNHHAPRFTEF